MVNMAVGIVLESVNSDMRFVIDSLPVSFCGDCLFVVGTNIQRTAKIIGRTAKIAITTEGLGRTEPLLSRSVCVTRDF